jgi:hypothetical protein
MQLCCRRRRLVRGEDDKPAAPPVGWLRRLISLSAGVLVLLFVLRWGVSGSERAPLAGSPAIESADRFPPAAAPPAVPSLTADIRRHSCQDIVMELPVVGDGVATDHALAGLRFALLASDAGAGGGARGGGGAPLSEGRVARGSLANDEYAFYQLCVEHHREHEHAIRLALRCTAGDVDLYLSTTNPSPTAESATWISAGIGDDGIVLPSNHPDFEPGARTIYIGVLGRGTDATAQLLGEKPNAYELTAAVALLPPDDLYNARRRLRRP